MKSERWETDSELGNVRGKCTRCRRIFPAIGLVPVDLWMPNGTHVIGWYCAGCTPRRFGKVRGQPSDGWVCAPLDGSDLDQRKRGIAAMLEPLGTAKVPKAIKSRNRARKLGEMKPLTGGG